MNQPIHAHRQNKTKTQNNTHSNKKDNYTQNKKLTKLTDSTDRGEKIQRKPKAKRR